MPGVARVGVGKQAMCTCEFMEALLPEPSGIRSSQQELPQSAMSSPGRGPGGPDLGGVPAVSSCRDISDTRTARTYAVFLKGKTLSNGLT